MKIPSHLINSNTVIAINGTRWMACLHAGFIGNTTEHADLKVITDPNVKSLNKIDSLEQSETDDNTSRWGRITAEGPRIVIRLSLTHVKALLDFCENDDTRFYANGVYITREHCVASDAITLVKLSLLSIDVNPDAPEGGCLVPRIFLNAFVKALTKDVKEIELTVYPESNSVVCTGGGDLYGESRCIAGQFPPFEQAFPKTINLESKITWTKESDLTLAQAGKNRVIHMKAVGSEQDVHCNGDLLKKILKYSDGTFQWENLQRPMLTQSLDGRMQFLLVPCRF
jgi:hypothetical protein